MLPLPNSDGLHTITYIELARDLLIGHRFGLPGLDRLVAGGMKPGELVAIGARPGSGKSFLIHHIAEYNASIGIPTLTVSAEMTAEQIGRARL